MYSREDSNFRPQRPQRCALIQLSYGSVGCILTHYTLPRKCRSRGVDPDPIGVDFTQQIYQTKITMPALLRFFKRFFLCLLFFLFMATHLVPSVNAQTSSQTQTTPPSHDYLDINADPSVPRNLHTFAQSVLIEVLAAVTCQAIGIDPIDPTTSCLGVNPATHQLGYIPISPQTGQQAQVGGILGVSVNMVAAMYTPTTSTSDYFQSLAADFGIVKTAHAAQKNGFEGLRPVLGLWTVSRNVSYFLLIIAFLFIGIGVMLRIKIDPRTVMTIQNQIPRVIIAIILITFSYAIAAVMIDGMWAITYAGINLISDATNTTIPCSTGAVKVSVQATQGILQTPLAYMNAIFAGDCVSDGTQSGLLILTNQVAASIGSVVQNAVNSFLVSDLKSGDCSIWSGSGLKACVSQAFAVFLEWLIRIAMLLVVFVALVTALFRVWWSLLKAYVQLLIYVFIAPIYIVFGLAPGRPLGFERWMRGFFANLIAFPLTAYLFVAAKVASDLYDSNAQDKFIPPLIGNPAAGGFGILIAFGFIMLAPTIVDLMKEKMKAPATKQGGQLAAGFMGAAAMAAAVPKKTWQHWNRRNPQTGAPLGWLANVREQMSSGAMRRIPGIGGKWAARKEYMQQTGQRPTQARLEQAGFDTRTSYQRKRDKKTLAPLFDQYQRAKAGRASPEALRDLRQQLGNRISDPRSRAQFFKEGPVADDEREYRARQQRIAEMREAMGGTAPPPPSTEPSTSDTQTGEPKSTTSDVTKAAAVGGIAGAVAGRLTQPSQAPEQSDEAEGLTTDQLRVQAGRVILENGTFDVNFTGPTAATQTGQDYARASFRPEVEVPSEFNRWSSMSLQDIYNNEEERTSFMRFFDNYKDLIRPELVQPTPPPPPGAETDTT